MSRVAVVTGAAGGIGAATSRAIAEDGWRVVAIDRFWSASQNGYARMTCDVADEAAVQEVFASLDRVDALVNNAAVMSTAPIAETEVESWDDVAAVNVRGAFVCLRAALPHLSESRGAVVNVASVHAHATSSGVAAYAASKGALVAFTRAAAVELGPSGVRVNAVLPGAVETNMLGAGLERGENPTASWARLVTRTPLRRVADPSEIAHTITFLADGERSSFTTGQALVIDGGALAQLSTE
jgi:NAD(P)-dependent dehydrogenase (short-subunit alcohol dehydrogenase family)